MRETINLDRKALMCIVGSLSKKSYEGFLSKFNNLYILKFHSNEEASVDGAMVRFMLV